MSKQTASAKPTIRSRRAVPGAPLRPRRDIHYRLVISVGGLALLAVCGLAVGLGFLVIPANRPTSSEPDGVAARERPAMASPPAIVETAAPPAIQTEPVEEEAPPRFCPAGLPRSAPEPQPAVEVVYHPPIPVPPRQPALEIGLPQDQTPIRPLPVKRRRDRGEEELRTQLTEIAELAIGREAPRLTAQGFQQATWPPLNLTENLLRNRLDLFGLPARMGDDCQLSPYLANNMQTLSREIRAALTDPEPVPALRRTLAQDHFRAATAVACLSQMLSVGEAEIRLLLVEQLARIEGKAASEALARLALYDLSADLRARAIAALNRRPASEYRQVLQSGFRHPWPPVADHAAEALVALNERGSLPALHQLLQAPDPRTPVLSLDLGFTVPELVRINHLRNCTLCHAESRQTTELVRGRVPVPGSPLPPPSVYYGDSSPGIFVRADTTYLRQDFSVLQQVEKRGPWPEWQRYDYVVRQRPLAAHEPKYPPRTETYPQLEAVRFALKEMQGL